MKWAGAAVGVGLVPVVAATVGAQDAPPIMNGIQETYRLAASQWLVRLTPVAQELFVGLALLEFLVSWLGQMLRGEGIWEMGAKFLVKFTLAAVLFAIITTFAFWFPPIINGFAVAGETAIGMGAVTPSEVVEVGRSTAMRVLGTLDSGVMLTNPAMAVYAAIAAIVISLSYIAIAGFLVMVWIEGFIVLGAGVLFLGFAAFRGTAGLSENMITYVLQVGVKIFLLYLIVGIGVDLARSWIPLIESSTFFGPASPLLQIVGGAVAFAVLAVRVPTAVAGRLGATSTSGISDALRATA